MQNFAEAIMDISIVVDDEDAPVGLLVGGTHEFSPFVVTALMEARGLAHILYVAGDSVIVWRKYVGEGFVIVEIAIAIFVETLADDRS